MASFASANQFLLFSGTERLKENSSQPLGQLGFLLGSIIKALGLHLALAPLLG